MLYIYHHIYPNKRGIEISKEQLERIRNNFTEKFIYIESVVHHSENEWATLFKLYKNKEIFKDGDIIFYLHTKSAVNSYSANIEWREFLEKELIDKSNFYIDKINLGFDTAGILMGIPNWSEGLYGGNFWYMSAKYLKSIEQNSYWDFNTRHSAETYFIQSGLNYNPYNNPLVNLKGYPSLLHHLKQQAYKNPLI